MVEERYYTIDEVAELFNVTRTAVYDWMKSGRLEWVKVGGRRRITSTALSKFVKPGDRLDTSGGAGVQSHEMLRPAMLGSP